MADKFENMEVAQSGDPITEANIAMHPDHPVRVPPTKFSLGQEVVCVDGVIGKIAGYENGVYNVICATVIKAPEEQLKSVM